MNSFLLFIFELALLFLLSKHTIAQLSIFFFNITKNRKLTGIILAILFFPGTFIHEFAHYLMAVILRVPAKKFNLIPVILQDEIKLGSVEIVKTDFIRRFIIGIAPLLFGVGLILLVLFSLLGSTILSNPLVLSLFYYLLFAISNTMYSSKKDMEGAWKLLLILLLLIVIIYFLKIHLPYHHLLQSIPSNLLLIINQATGYLLLPLLINILIAGIFAVLNKLFFPTIHFQTTE